MHVLVNMHVFGRRFWKPETSVFVPFSGVSVFVNCEHFHLKTHTFSKNLRVQGFKIFWGLRFRGLSFRGLRFRGLRS